MTNQKPFRIALVGAGHIAEQNHIPALKRVPDRAEIVAVCGRDAKRTATFAERNDIAKSYVDFDQMLSEIHPDITINCTANNLHYPFTIKALEKGSHVFCEKPPAMHAVEAREMAELAKSKGKFLGYNFQRRQSAAYALIKRQIDEGYFGEVYHIKAEFLRRRGIPGWGNFTNKTIQGGGALIDLGVHVLDMALNLMNYQTPKKIVGNTYDFIGKSGGVGLKGIWDPTSFEVEDACFAYLSFANNASISLSSAFALNRKEEETVNLEIFGSKAGAVLNPLEIYSESFGELSNSQFPHLKEVDSQFENTMAFLDACEGKPSNICNGEQGAVLQQIIEDIYLS